MPPRLGINTLRVLGGKPIQYFDLRPDQSVTFGVCVADRAAGAFGRDRPGNVTLGLGYHYLQGFIEPRIGGFDFRGCNSMNGVDMSSSRPDPLSAAGSRLDDGRMPEARLENFEARLIYP